MEILLRCVWARSSKESALSPQGLCLILCGSDRRLTPEEQELWDGVWQWWRAIMGTGLGEGVGSRVVGILSLFNVLEDVTIEDTAAVVDSGCKDDADEAFGH